MGIENLKPFKKGDPGGPGRPKGSKNTATVINQYLKSRRKGRNPITGKECRMSVRQQIVLAQIGQALSGNTKAFQAIIDRAEGKITETIQHSGVDGTPLVPPQIIFQGVDAPKEGTDE